MQSEDIEIEYSDVETGNGLLLHEMKSKKIDYF